MKKKLYNYVYCIDYPNKMKYIGVRSCDCEIVDDSYSGSSKFIPMSMRLVGIKTILFTFDTREEAMLKEIELHALYNVKDNIMFYNQCNSYSTKFICNKESNLRGAQKRIGRTKETHEYIRKQIEARSAYKGENQTPAQKFRNKNRTEAQILADRTARSKRGSDRSEAQKLGSIETSKKLTGVKNPDKGHPGATSTSFIPWYFIDANGTRTEVYNVSKKDYAKIFNVTERQLVYRFNKENLDKLVTQGPFKGWILGNLAPKINVKKK